MTPIRFPEQTVTIAENQPEYMPLPAHRFPGGNGRICCCWKMSWKERIKLFFTGVLWQQILTFNKPLQPQLLTVEKPEME